MSVNHEQHIPESPMAISDSMESLLKMTSDIMIKIKQQTMEASE